MLPKKNERGSSRGILGIDLILYLFIPFEERRNPKSCRGILGIDLNSKESLFLLVVEFLLIDHILHNSLLYINLINFLLSYYIKRKGKSPKTP